MRRALLATVVASLIGPTAHAHLVTLEVTDAPLAEVVTELVRQTGAAIDLRRMGGEAAEPLLVTLDVENAPLRAVLRLIAEQTGGHFRSENYWGEYWYVHEPDPLAEAPAARAGPYLIRVAALEIVGVRALSFDTTAEKPLRMARYMRVALSIDADDALDLMRLPRVAEDVSALDDTGQRLLAPPAADLEPGRFDIPWWWHGLGPGSDSGGSLLLSQPAPAAASVTTLQGSLIAHANARRIAFRVPLPARALPVEVEQDGGSLQVTEAGVEGRDYAIRAAFRPTGAAWGRYSLTATDVRLEMADGSRLHGGRGVEARAPGPGATPAGVHWDYQFEDAAGMQPTALVCELVFVSPETETIPFEFQNIPLPTWGQ